MLAPVTREVGQNAGVDRLEELKTLGKENSVWRLNNSTGKILVSQFAQNDHPLFVLPMRDVWIAGVRFRGTRPTVCLSDQRLIAVSHPGLLARGVWVSFDRPSFVAVSEFSNRAFEIKLSDGRELKLRGMIGPGRVDAMTERLYAEISSGLPHSA